MATPRIAFRFALEPVGVRRAISKMESLQPVFERAMGALLTDYAERMIAEAKALCPVDTGTLQASIEVEVRKLVAGWVLELKPNADGSAPYAGHVEFGTVSMPARPFIRPVAEKYHPMFVADLRALRREVIKLAA